MKRHIKYIVVHSTATFDPKVSQYYGDFHYVVERSGEIKRIHPETTIIKNIPIADNEAIHIAYAGGRNKTGNLGDTRTPVQEEWVLLNSEPGFQYRFASPAFSF